MELIIYNSSEINTFIYIYKSDINLYNFNENIYIVFATDLII